MQNFYYFLLNLSLTLSINETKLNYQSFLSFNFPNYQFIHKHRNEKNGAGGVGLLVHNSLKFTRYNNLDFLDLEVCAISLKIGSSNIVIVSYYNPPSSTLSTEIFKQLQNENFIVLGDLNSKSELFGCRKSNTNGELLVQLLEETNVILLNDNEHTYFS